MCYPSPRSTLRGPCSRIFIYTVHAINNPVQDPLTRNFCSRLVVRESSHTAYFCGNQILTEEFALVVSVIAVANTITKLMFVYFTMKLCFYANIIQPVITESEVFANDMKGDGSWVAVHIACQRANRGKSTVHLISLLIAHLKYRIRQ